MNYESKDIFFKNKTAGVTLAGTLTMPQSQHPTPAVLLISGVGPNDRDYTMFSRHKLFAVLADCLTQHGIAVLRYDKRGVGKSTGKGGSSVTSKDLADDALAGIEYLKTIPEINVQKIGVIGHSEGGMIASMLATQSPNIAFIVLLAAVSATDIDNLVKHTAAQLKVDGASDGFLKQDSFVRAKLLSISRTEPDIDKAEKLMLEAVKNYLDALTEEQKTESQQLMFALNTDNAPKMVKLFNSPWYRFFLNYDPIAVLKKITIPVLALNGDRDFIALADIDLHTIQETLKQSDNQNCTAIELPNLNHWFQTCKTGALSEYGATEEALAPVMLQTISDWIIAQTT
jgi:pimeloyl-ACP methyl ester carboxylesterase